MNRLLALLTLVFVIAVELTEVYGKVFVHVNLNTVTDDEILSIIGCSVTSY